MPHGQQCLTKDGDVGIIRLKQNYWIATCRPVSSGSLSDLLSAFAVFANQFAQEYTCVLLAWLDHTATVSLFMHVAIIKLTDYHLYMSSSSKYWEWVMISSHPSLLKSLNYYASVNKNITYICTIINTYFLSSVLHANGESYLSMHHVLYH